jgi:hypothetical protein
LSYKAGIIMNEEGDKAKGDIVRLIGLFVSFFLIWVFFQVLSQINILWGVLFLIAGILVIIGTVRK